MSLGWRSRTGNTINGTGEMTAYGEPHEVADWNRALAD